MKQYFLKQLGQKQRNWKLKRANRLGMDLGDGYQKQVTKCLSDMLISLGYRLRECRYTAILLRATLSSIHFQHRSIEFCVHSSQHFRNCLRFNKFWFVLTLCRAACLMNSFSFAASNFWTERSLPEHFWGILLNLTRRSKTQTIIWIKQKPPISVKVWSPACIKLNFLLVGQIPWPACICTSWWNVRVRQKSTSLSGIKCMQN